MTYSGEDWKYFFENWQLPHTSNKTILGGIIAGIIGILIAKWWFRFKQPVWDAFAFALPLCMAIQRVGCLLRGCCFGKPTNLPWAINYSFESIPYHVHLNNGLIDPISNTSLAIHPTQLYQIIYCLVIALIIWRTRKFWKAPGNLFFSSVILYGCFRFLSEFFRDPAADGIGGDVIWGLKYVQWGILFFIIALSTFVLYKEHTWHFKTKVPESTLNNLYRNLIFITFLTYLIWLGRNWFTLLELTVLYIIILPCILGVCWQIYKALTIPSLRWLPPALATGCLIFMGQKLPKETTLKDIYYTLNIGGSLGKYYNTVKYNPSRGGWGGGTCYHEQIFKEQSQMVGIGFSKSEVAGFQNVTYGVNIYSGIQKENKLNELPVNEYTIWGVNPFYRTDDRWFGIGFGGHLGKLSWLYGKPLSEGSITSGSNKLPFYPEFLVRVGPYDIFDLEYKYGFQFPSPFPGLKSQFSIGTGFGLQNGTSLRFGVAFPLENSFISGQFLIEKRYGFQFLYLFGTEENEELPQRQFVFGLNYRFGFDKKPTAVNKK